MKIGSKKNAAPYIIWMVVFTVLPLLLVVYFAFTDADGRFTLNNLLAIGDYIHVFVLSLLLAMLATFICLLIAYPISYMLSRLRRGQQGIWLMLVMLPMWMNFLLRTYALMTLLENNGLINRFLAFVSGGRLGPYEMINTAGAVVLGMVYNYLPYMILPLYNAMLKIDQSVIDAAEDLGAGPLQKLIRVQLPLSKPGIRTGVVMVFVPGVATFIISKMLGGGSFWLIGDLIEAQFLGSSYNYNIGSAMSLMLMVVVLLLISATGGFESEDMEGVV